MNILVIFPKDGQTGTFIARGFRALGHTCDHLWGEGAFNGGRYDLAVCSRTPGLSKHLCITDATKLVCWNTDVREDLGKFDREFGPGLSGLWGRCDAIYTMAKGQVWEYRRRFPGKHVRWLSQGIDPKTHKIPYVSEEDREKYSCDVMFAGSYRSKLHSDRIQLLEAIGKRFDLKMFGYDTKIVDEEHNKACACAKICLGNSAFPWIELSMSVRDYKIMGAGGLLLTNMVKNIENWFGDCVVYYSNVTECLKAIDRLLSMKQKDRDRIALGGMAMVHKEHRYQDRCKVIIDDYLKGLF